MAKAEEEAGPERPWFAVVLAAGQGTRMRSARPKVLHDLLGKPLIAHVLDLLCGLPVSRIALVVGHGAEAVREALGARPVSWVVQENQLGTAHAVLCAEQCLPDVNGDVLVVCGDTPLIEPGTLLRFMEDHRRSGRMLSVLSAKVSNPAGYGRILRERGRGRLLGIAEERDAMAAQRRIREVNTGVYAADARFLFGAVRTVRPDNAQGEYYLTDIVGFAVGSANSVEAVPAATDEEALGVNSRWDLSRAEEVLLRRLRCYWMECGVTFELAASVYIEGSVVLSQDVVIGPHVMLLGKTTVAPEAVIGAYSLLQDAEVGRGTVLAPYTHLVRGGPVRGADS